MKYLKLFEHWLLTEGEKQDAFDKARPGNWPVLETTIKDAVTADFSKKFLQSIFERALKEENRKKLEVSGGEITKADAIFDISKIYKDKASKNTTLKKDLEEFVSFLVSTCKGLSTFDRKKVASEEKVTAYLDECIENLTNKFAKTEFSENKAFSKIFYYYNKDRDRLFRADKAKVCINFCEELKDKLSKIVAAADAKKRRYITFSWGEGDDAVTMFNLVCDSDIAKGGDVKDGIINFKCEDFVFKVENGYWKKDENGYSEFVTDDAFYNSIDGDSMNEIDGKGITFGQVMYWLNAWQDGQSEPTLLSSSGKSKYYTACTEIFGGEEAASLPSFASTSVKIGNKNINLANSSKDGTIVPVLAKNQVVGTVGFAYNSSEISETGLKSLASPEIWKMLNSAAKSIIIVGNTDGSGPDEYNKTLSLKRADAVLEVLSKDKRFAKLKATKNVTTRGDGKENLLVPDKKGKDQEAAATNRRVELIIDGQPASDKLKK